MASRGRPSLAFTLHPGLVLHGSTRTANLPAGMCSTVNTMCPVGCNPGYPAHPGYPFQPVFGSHRAPRPPSWPMPSTWWAVCEQSSHC